MPRLQPTNTGMMYSRQNWARNTGYNRYGHEWTKAEDRKLLRLGESNMHWHDVANKMERSMSSCQTRYYSLRAGMKLE